MLKVETSVAEPHHFYAAPASAAPAAPAPTLLYARQNFKNDLKFKHMLKLYCLYDSVRW
jgi:hypothetical protein